MSRIRRMIRTIHQVNSFSKQVVHIGFLLMLVYYIVGIYALYIAPSSANYFELMAVYRGALECAPATFASAFSAAVICELILKSHGE